MKLIVSEKPSVSRAISAILGATQKKNGYLEGNGYLVSWCVGHLVELAPAASYDESYAKWRKEDLPILPDPWQYKISEGTKQQFTILKQLMQDPRVESLICATDAGREGELIFRLVYLLAGCKKPVQRLWISSMEDSAIREGFERLKPASEYDALYQAALCRAQADWLVGINATRHFSLLYGQTLHIGRVMTPTLALLVEREAQIAAFRPTPFYHVALEYKARFYKPTRTANPAHRNMASKIFYYKAKNDKVWDDLSVEEKKECARTLRQMRSEQRKLPTHPVQETSYKAIQYVRYADDFIVGVIGSHEDAKKLKQDLTAFLKEKLGLTLSAEKTKITNTAENARFLGYDISVSRSQDIKRLKNGKRQRVYSGVVQLRMPLEKWTAKLLEYGAIRIKKDESGKERWKTMPRGKLINRTDIEILSRYNSEIRGLYNYYAIAGNVSTLNHFSSRMKYSMLKTFGSKYRCKVRKIKERYVKNGEFTVAYKTKSGMKESVYYHDGFRKKTEPALGQVDMLDIYKKYDKPNSLAIRLHTNKCELCGTDCDGLEMHQVRRLKDLNGEQEWERIMLQRRRKTLAVCPSCHIEIHNSMKS